MNTYSRRKNAFLAFSIASLLAVAGPLLALTTGNQVVGSQGAVLRIVSGSYAELFPGGTELAADNRVLALDVSRAGASQRLLVPGTEEVFEEFSPTLVHDSRAEVTWVLWEGIHNGIHPLLYLRSWDGAGWSEQIELSGSPFSRKGHPQLVVTRDRSLEPQADGSSAEVERAILHVFWWEEQGSELRKRYAPLVLEGGRFLGAHPVRDISDLFPPDAAVPALASFGDLLKIQPGPTAGSVLAGFVEQDAARVVALQIEVVPRALSRLAEDVVDFVKAQSPGLPLDQLAALVRDRIAANGASIHPATLDYVKQSVAGLIAGMDPAQAASGGMESLGLKAGMHILIIGQRTVQAGEPDPDEVLTVSRFGGVRPWHHLRLSKVASRLFPADAGAGAQLFLSRNGREACLAWLVEGKVVYRESAGEGWAEPQEIALTESLDAATAMAILAQRTTDR